jgi:hypothetical protein
MLPWDSCCYGLDLKPEDICITFQLEGLHIKDCQNVLPMQSPTLQLWCLAQEQGLSIDCQSNAINNSLFVPITKMVAFLQLLEQAYPTIDARLFQFFISQISILALLTSSISLRLQYLGN